MSLGCRRASSGACCGYDEATQRAKKGADLMRILGFGGSLREASFNRALLVEAAALAPPGADLDLSLLPVIGSLPLFDQDMAGRAFPRGAVELKNALQTADGLLIATPEYNWGIPGFLKNAFDWASRPASDVPAVFGDLPVALIGAGGLAGTRYAQTAWVSVFRYLKMRPWFGESLFIDRSWERFDESGRLTDEPTRERLQAVIGGFFDHCAKLPRTRPEDGTG
jgi:chromate reductase, NAD(P)H dehydrogenase (quinone)